MRKEWDEEQVDVEIGRKVLRVKRGLFTRLRGSSLADLFDGRVVRLQGSALSFQKLIDFLKGDTSKLPDNKEKAEIIQDQLEIHGLLYLLEDQKHPLD